MQTNPFKPTAGKTPPTIIGREDVLEEFNEGLTNGPGAPGRLMRIAGVRGTGKTVLLDECSRLAQSRGWTVIKEVATEGLCQRILEQLQPKFQAKHARFEPTVAGISIGSIDIERIGPSLRDAMRQTITKKGMACSSLSTRFKTQSSMRSERSPLRFSRLSAKTLISPLFLLGFLR